MEGHMYFFTGILSTNIQGRTMETLLLTLLGLQTVMGMG